MQFLVWVQTPLSRFFQGSASPFELEITAALGPLALPPRKSIFAAVWLLEWPRNSRYSSRQHPHLHKLSEHPLGRHSCPALAYLANSYHFNDVLWNGNAEEKVLNMNTICKTSSPNSSAHKWIQQCSFSIMGAIHVFFSENNAFCKITLNRKCLCCHFWLLTASSQWDLPQHKTDLAVFADWGPTSPDTWNTDGNISA